MRDYRNAKAMAQTLRDDLSGKLVTLSHSESLELVAHMLGMRDWNVLAAKIDAEPVPVPADAGSEGKKAATALFCSFCGKSQYEVAKLIAGPSAFICDACVGLCDDILVDGDPNLAGVTRDVLASKSVEDLILLKARIGRILSSTRRVRETIAAYIQNGATSPDTKTPPPVAFFLRKSPEERLASMSEMETRIRAMEQAMAIAGELLEQRLQ